MPLDERRAEVVQVPDDDAAGAGRGGVGEGVEQRPHRRRHAPLGVVARGAPRVDTAGDVDPHQKRGDREALRKTTAAAARHRPAAAAIERSPAATQSAEPSQTSGATVKRKRGSL